MKESRHDEAFLREVFDRLYRHFGPRHWWPAETEFEVIVGAILTQSVAWRNVEKAIDSLKKAGLLDPLALYRATEEELWPLLRPTRYYQTKAKKLKAFVKHLVEEYGGDLAKMFSKPLHAMRQELLGIWGIGEETADSILLYAGRYPIFVVDAYTRRIFSRLGVFSPDVSYHEMQEHFMRHLPPDEPYYNEYHALIDALGNRLCFGQRPRCGECPLEDLCHYHSQGEGGEKK